MSHLRDALDEAERRYNHPDFIETDPIQVPRQFTRLQDVEIAGFLTATLSWGRRSTIIAKAKTLISLMDNRPHDFILNHEEKDRKRLLSFKHRTFQPLDTLYFVEFLQWYYRQNPTLETAFSSHLKANAPHTEAALNGFHRLFFSLPNAPERTKKHVPAPDLRSTCKRLNLFLRWMVRNDGKGVDFGLWKTIQPAQLLIPLDVHVEKVARQLGLLERKSRDWNAVLELTTRLKTLDPKDPVRYDFALFGLGVLNKREFRPF